MYKAFKLSEKSEQIECGAALSQRAVIDMQ